MPQQGKTPVLSRFLLWQTCFNVRKSYGIISRYDAVCKSRDTTNPSLFSYLIHPPEGALEVLEDDIDDVLLLDRRDKHKII